MKDPFKTDQWVLVDVEGCDVSLGQIFYTFRGEEVELTGGRPPHKPSSTGRIYVEPFGGGPTSEYFPSVCNLKWIRREEFDGHQAR